VASLPRQIILGLDVRDDGVGAAAAGPHANHLHLASDRSTFTGQMLFLMPNCVKALKTIYCNYTFSKSVSMLMIHDSNLCQLSHNTTASE